LVEKTKGLEETQQQSIDQLQLVQDQLQVMTRLLTAQQSETRKLNEQVGTLTSTLDSLRQSFAAIPPEASQPEARERPRARARGPVAKGRSKATAQRKRNTRS
jgi:phage-related tail protein